MKKQLFAILLVSFAIVLTACSGSHTHAASGGWSCDLENHWQTCECGEQINTAAHTLEEGFCTDCGCEIAIYEDGTAMLICYNEGGDLTRLVFYAADGSIESEDRVEYTHDDNGNLVNQKTYTNDQLSCEYEFSLTETGETYLSKDIYYYEDGSRDSSTYDEKENVLTSYSYDANGTVVFGCEYLYDANGICIGDKTYEGSRLVSEQAFQLDKEGNQTTAKHISYNADGSYNCIEYDEYGNEVLEGYYDATGTPETELRYENQYDAEGHRTFRRIYKDGRLTEEMEFLFGSDDSGEWSRSGKTTIYHEDGTKTVSDSDPDGAWSSEITYNADGSVMEDRYYEYLTDESGEAIGSKGYLNSVLVEEVQSIRNESGAATGLLMIDYAKDGSKTVREYNDVFDLVKETVYDADGKVISET